MPTALHSGGWKFVELTFSLLPFHFDAALLRPLMEVLAGEGGGDHLGKLVRSAGKDGGAESGEACGVCMVEKRGALVAEREEAYEVHA